MNRRKKGFTLVELLVVIGILGILMSALFPAISSAMLAANTAAMSMILKNIDPNWHNDDQATLDLKAARLEIEKLKAEQNIFE